MIRSLIILDLDETLIYACEKPLARQPDFVVGPHLAYIRPHFHEFLAFARHHFSIAVWTSSSGDYAVAVAGHLFRDVHLEFIWSRSRCTGRFDYDEYEQVWIKKLVQDEETRLSARTHPGS